MAVAHILHGLAWLGVAIIMSGSIPRTLKGQARWADGTWGIAWFLALVQLGYTVRWLIGMAPDHAPGTDAATAAGLLTFSALAAIGLVRRRVLIDGWRW